MKNKKCFFSCLAAMFAFCICFSISAFAAETEEQGVSVEYDENLNIPKEMETQNNITTRKSYVDLSKQNDSFIIGKLDANEAYFTNSYGITKSRIKVSL